VLAIVRFEGDHGMPVTGKPTTELAAALDAAVKAR
jgi:hypothetical protein